MRLTVFNGSPRARVSNTRIFTDAFAEGFRQAGGEVETRYITGLTDSLSLFTGLGKDDCVLLAFPLYVDSMPSGVKALIEDLEPLKGKLGGVRFCFLIQSGFPEAVHSRGVERYLERLTGKVGGTYLGTIIRGGANDVGNITGTKRARALEPFRELGEGLARTGELETEGLGNLARLETFSPFMVVFLRILDRTGLLGLIWRKAFREWGTYDRRFDRPYE